MIDWEKPLANLSGQRAINLHRLPDWTNWYSPWLVLLEGHHKALLFDHQGQALNDRLHNVDALEKHEAIILVVLDRLGDIQCYPRHSPDEIRSLCHELDPSSQRLAEFTVHYDLPTGPAQS